MSEERKSRYELFLEGEQEAQPTKRCSKCKEVKSLGEFHKSRHRKLGVVSCCKECANPAARKYKNREDMFWKSFQRRTIQVGDCLEWNGAYANNRVPTCNWRGKEGVNVRRIVYRLAVGAVPDEMFVITKCLNRRCVRHSHLLLATHEDVVVRKNNTHATGEKHGSRTKPENVACGERHARAVLTADDVRTIRAEYVPFTVSCATIARRYGVTLNCIYEIVHRKTWKHVE